MTEVAPENVVASVSRSGRRGQRYKKGRRQVVGSIPYRYKSAQHTSMEDGQLEVLVITSRKGKGMVFPKGGWELDESKKEAALRETLEEAGVTGVVEKKLGQWSFKSKGHMSDGFMFPLLVQEQLDSWPEKNSRQRKWMSVTEARQVCRHDWMKEALDILVNRLSAKEEPEDKQGESSR